MERLADLAREAFTRASVEAPARVGSYCLAGADFPSDLRTLERHIMELGLARETAIRNDAFAALRAGSEKGWGIAVVCGAGVNAVGVAPDGSSARFAGIGDLSGDWGGGYGLGLAALGAAVRARDGRGSPTSLAERVPAHFGLARPGGVSRRIYEGSIEARRLEDLAPVVFDAAAAGDPVARAIIDRLADELATMAIAIARRLRIARRELDVVLTGGVFRATDPAFYERLEAGVRSAVPGARIHRLRDRPVLGAALMGLDELGVTRGGAAERRLRHEFRAYRTLAG
jgi:N-acetylglucosamine kinase-like BadF-type ATPase